MSLKSKSAVDIFDEAADLLQDQQASFLDSTCGNDGELRREIDALLFALAHPDGRLDKFAAPEIDLDSTWVSETAGERIGDYKLIERIGEGGFGVVWKAEQHEPRRSVALKIIKLGMDTLQLIARFQAEKQTLALMDHPNIARIFDASATPAGRPYFAMELVEGAPITKICDDHELSVKQRLELFVKVCNAVQHAHQKGIIHRDLKPSNILVVQQDGHLEPKVIDFGVAKAVQEDLTGHPQFTPVHQRIGTPAYMSPEQAGLETLDVDTRSDVYALGAILYELITGQTPLNFDGMDYDLVISAVRDKERPRPSTRLATLDEKELKAVAANRGMESLKLRRFVRGDLDWIIMKSLEMDRKRRYETANGLAVDLGSFLRNEPVVARPPSAAYRFAKFTQRNRLAVLTGCAIGLMLVIGIFVAMLFAFQAQRERKRAESIRDFLIESFQAQDPDELGQQDIRIGEAMRQALHRLDGGQLAKNPELELPLRDTIVTILNNLGRNAEALPLARRCLELRQRLLPMDKVGLAVSLNNLAFALQVLGRPAEALPVYESALEINRKLSRRDDARLASSINNVGTALFKLDRIDEALIRYQEAQQMRKRLYPTGSVELAGSLNNIGMCLQRLGRSAEALPVIQSALAINQKIYGSNGDHPEIAMQIDNIGLCYEWLGKFGDAFSYRDHALAMYQRLYPTNHPDVALAMNNMGRNLRQLGRVPEAQMVFERALEINRSLYPGDHPEVAEGLRQIGKCLQLCGKQAEALLKFQEALDMTKRCFTNDHSDIADSQICLAGCLQELKQSSNALTHFQAGWEIRRKIFPPGHGEIATAQASFGTVLAEVGRYREAEPLLVDAITMLERDMGLPVQIQIHAVEALIKLYKDTGQPEKAAFFQTKLDSLNLRKGVIP